MPLLTYILVLTLIVSTIISRSFVIKSVHSSHVLSETTEAVSPTPTPTVFVIRQLTKTSQIMEQINSYRNSFGLGSLTESPAICSFAQIRAQEIASDFSHKGSQGRVNTHTLPFPSYHFAAENIAMTSNPNQVFDLWKNSPGHDANMKSLAIYGCIGQNNNFFALELWTP